MEYLVSYFCNKCGNEWQCKHAEPCSNYCPECDNLTDADGYDIINDDTDF